ncbi:PREDICTED: protein TIC 100-like [Trachymyrmex septentrionalis]|uniref:protein TIC 100-like n=1 Tax=Trachymyrmex septentrionalis TaxID=34720 RepID=UPI00084F4C69|nr:PREDICTED: protein TIC 100-like [Trachymyrmex septentrionalis]
MREKETNEDRCDRRCERDDAQQEVGCTGVKQLFDRWRPCALARLSSASLARSLARWLADWPDDLDPSTSSKKQRETRGGWVRACVTNSLTDAPYPSGRRHSVRGWQWRWRLLDDDNDNDNNDNDDDDDDDNDNDDDDDDDDDNDNGGTALRIHGTGRNGAAPSAAVTGARV